MALFCLNPNRRDLGCPCPRPLSRKKLKQLMPLNKQLTSMELAAKTGRKTIGQRRSEAREAHFARLEREDNLKALQQQADRNEAQEIVQEMAAERTREGLLSRLGKGLIGGLLGVTRFERRLKDRSEK